MQIRNRIWSELMQSKHHHIYCILTAAFQRRLLNVFNFIILSFSSAGVMGWKVWENVPVIACAIVSAISFLKLISPHIAPSEKQIDNLDLATKFYCKYYNDLEKLWMKYDNYRISDEEAEDAFYALKATEDTINDVVCKIIKRTNKNRLKKTDMETRNYFNNVSNLNHHEQRQEKRR